MLGAHFAGKADLEYRILGQGNLLYGHLAIGVGSKLQQLFQTTGERAALSLAMEQLLLGFDAIFGRTTGHAFVDAPLYHIQFRGKGGFTCFGSSLQIIIHIIHAIQNGIGSQSTIYIILKAIHTLNQGTALLSTIEHFFHGTNFIGHRNVHVCSKAGHHHGEAENKRQQKCCKLFFQFLNLQSE